jgi:hypothetical protein
MKSEDLLGSMKGITLWQSLFQKLEIAESINTAYMGHSDSLSFSQSPLLVIILI